MGLFQKRKATDALSKEPAVTPEVWIKSATFSDGTTLNFSREEVVVFVGPNNAGKSVALRDIRQRLKDAKEATLVVTQIEFHRDGTIDDLRRWIKLFESSNDGRLRYELYENSIDVGMSELYIENVSQKSLGSLAGFFCLLLDADTRLSAAKPPKSIAITHESPKHPIHHLQRDDALENRISALFKKAFGQELIVHRNAGNFVPLYCGTKPTQSPAEDRVSLTYIERLEQLPELHEQGDGMRSFAGVLLYTFSVPQTVILIDEPEAFLHPPQARLLGRMLTSEDSRAKQLFISTHSGDFLRGLLDSESRSIRVVRIQREGAANSVTELTSDRIEELWKDPLLRYSNALDGLFHEKVVVCEGDSDCKFYAAVFDTLIAKHDDDYRRQDVMFIHGGGKSRLPLLVRALREISVPVIAVTDLDILSDEQPLHNLADAAGSRWADIQDQWKSLKNAIDAMKPELNSDETCKEIRKILDDVKDSTFPSSARKKVQEVLRRTSPWSTLKKAGANYIPSGQPTNDFQQLKGKLRDMGIFIVEVGQIEGFCKSVGNHGPAWVNEVLQKDLANDPELDSARKFVSEMLLSEW